MLASIGKLIPLALSTGALICLVVVFVGCTSPSSPNDMYFMKVCHTFLVPNTKLIVRMKVNLSDFPELGKLDLRRSINVAGIDASSMADQATSVINSETQNAADGVTQASAAAQTAVSHASDQITSLTDDLKKSLPAYYSIGLWGFCQGQHDAAPFSNCSTPSTTFTFNLLKAFGSLSTEIEDLLPSDGKRLLAGSRHVSEWTISAYITGFITMLFAIIFGLTTMAFSWGKLPLIACSLVCTGQTLFGVI